MGSISFLFTAQHQLKKFCLAVLSALVTTQAQADLEQAKLFEIWSPNSKKPSYILGTVHGDVGLNEFPLDVTKLIKDSRVVLAEVDLSAEDLKTYDKDPFKVIAKFSPFSGGGLDPKTVGKLTELGFPRWFAEKLSDKDCGALNVLSQVSPKAWPLDYKILKIAHENDKPVSALDTKELRSKARAKNDSAQGACSLKQLLNQYSVSQLRQAFESQGAKEVAEYRAGADLPEEVVNSPIVVERNLRWMKEIEKDVNKGGAFIAVGDAHLDGVNGLLRLMRRKGFSVKEASPEKANPATTRNHEGRSSKVDQK